MPLLQRISAFKHIVAKCLNRFWTFYVICFSLFYLRVCMM